MCTIWRRQQWRVCLRACVSMCVCVRACVNPAGAMTMSEEELIQIFLIMAGAVWMACLLKPRQVPRKASLHIVSVAQRQTISSLQCGILHCGF